MVHLDTESNSNSQLISYNNKNIKRNKCKSHIGIAAGTVTCVGIGAVAGAAIGHGVTILTGGFGFAAIPIGAAAGALIGASIPFGVKFVIMSCKGIYRRIKIRSISIHTLPQHNDPKLLEISKVSKVLPIESSKKTLSDKQEKSFFQISVLFKILKDNPYLVKQPGVFPEKNHLLQRDKIEYVENINRRSKVLMRGSQDYHYRNIHNQLNNQEGHTGLLLLVRTKEQEKDPKEIQKNLAKITTEMLKDAFMDLKIDKILKKANIDPEKKDYYSEEIINALPPLEREYVSELIEFLAEIYSVQQANLNLGAIKIHKLEKILCEILFGIGHFPKGLDIAKELIQNELTFRKYK